ncbi:MAG TPA: hypothetical protein VI756_10055 [Blastocatellia bacterium]
MGSAVDGFYLSIPLYQDVVKPNIVGRRSRESRVWKNFTFDDQYKPARMAVAGTKNT